MEKYCEALSNTDNCIFNGIKLGESYSNYAYTLNIAGKDCYSVICMDNGNGAFTDEQCEWYRSQILSRAGDGEDPLPSLLFFHIPP